MIRRLLPVLLLVLQPSVATAADMPSALKLGYDIHVGGILLGRMTLETILADGRYRIAVGARANDLLDRLVHWSYVAEATGRLDGGPPAAGGVAPGEFRSVRTLRDKRWVAALDYDAPGSAPRHLQVPPQSAEDENAVPAEQRPGTLDILSASVAIARATEANGGTCAAQTPVFDGRRRFDVVATPIGDRDLEPSGYSIFKGRAIGCRVDVVPVAGFRPARRNEMNFWTATEDGKPRGFDLWLGRPAPGDPLVPVRMEAKELFYTRVLGHLAAVDRTAPDLGLKLERPPSP